MLYCIEVNEAHPFFYLCERLVFSYVDLELQCISSVPVLNSTISEYCKVNTIAILSTKRYHGGVEGLNMTTEILTKTEYQINKAFELSDIALLEKETIFVLNNFAINLSDAYSDVIRFVKPIKVKLRTDPKILFTEKYLSSLKQILSYSERVFTERMETAELKLAFDFWFYEVTSQGSLVCEYNPDVLVNISDAAEQLGVSRTMIYKYIDRGLEVVGEKGSQKIPRFILNAWKNPVYAVQMQWIHQMKRERNQTMEQKIDSINRHMEEFEMQYKGTFHHLFGHLSGKEIDEMAEAIDIQDWKELEENKQRLLEQFNG